jgi:hypothetical protein
LPNLEIDKNRRRREIVEKGRRRGIEDIAKEEVSGIITNQKKIEEKIRGLQKEGKNRYRLNERGLQREVALQKIGILKMIT